MPFRYINGSINLATAYRQKEPLYISDRHNGYDNHTSGSSGIYGDPNSMIINYTKRKLELPEGKTIGGKAKNLFSIRSTYLPPYVVIPWEVDVSEAVDDASYYIQSWKSERDYGDKFAVRSSADCEDGKENSYAGVFKSILDVPLTSLTESVREVRRDVRTMKIKRGVSPKMGVIIMPMLDASMGGVLFSKEPVEGTNRMLLEYERGVGGVVDGTSNSKQLFIDVDWDSEKFFQLGSKQLVGMKDHELAVFFGISTKETLLVKLWEEAKRLEKDFRCPIEIEWAISFYKNEYKLWILQVKPITATKEKND